MIGWLGILSQRLLQLEILPWAIRGCLSCGYSPCSIFSSYSSLSFIRQNELEMRKGQAPEALEPGSAAPSEGSALVESIVAGVSTGRIEEPTPSQWT
ncbi:hypothetical protein CDL15_Pgr024949 [Punica granatum]|uniref:Uncharacterized protein n=1 Tax=Punica granatum TaxID=22663 RepID=A0A218W9K8_PUNGR|nr:hypothetical protein CDL15_Pgr024949 [Punica granatum]